MIQHLTEIVEEARKRGKKRLAVAYGQDSHTLEAVYEAYKEGLVEPTLYGEKSVIEQVCAENDIDIKAFNIVDETSDVKCVQQAVAAVVAGNADVLMKGLVSTDKYMRGILNKEAGLFPPKGVLSHVSIVEMPCYHKLLVIDDLGVERSTEYAMEQMFFVIDSRYRSRRPMIITTNLKLGELKNPPDLAHARIYDRILERCAPILFDGKNFREENAGATREAAKELVSRN